VNTFLLAKIIAFGVNDQEFGQVVSQIKKNLAMADTEAPQGTEQGTEGGTNPNDIP
jgi:hypothetical protein